MSNKYDKELLRDLCEDEGIEYTIRHYLDPNNIEDLELRQLCVDCEKLLKQIEEKLDIE